VAYDETLEALEDCFEDWHLTAVYRIELKTRTQGVGEFFKYMPQPSNSWPTAPTLHYPKNITREAGEGFADGVHDPSVKI
jgi:hypothetical protein